MYYYYYYYHYYYYYYCLFVCLFVFLALQHCGCIFHSPVAGFSLLVFEVF